MSAIGEFLACLAILGTLATVAFIGWMAWHTRDDDTDEE
jgi:uncharacterized membrane protein